MTGLIYDRMMRVSFSDKPHHNAPVKRYASEQHYKHHLGGLYAQANYIEKYLTPQGRTKRVHNTLSDHDLYSTITKSSQNESYKRQYSSNGNVLTEDDLWWKKEAKLCSEEVIITGWR